MVGLFVAYNDESAKLIWFNDCLSVFNASFLSLLFIIFTCRYLTQSAVHFYLRNIRIMISKGYHTWYNIVACNIVVTLILKQLCCLK